MEGGWKEGRKEGNIEGLVYHLELLGSFTWHIIYPSIASQVT